MSGYLTELDAIHTELWKLLGRARKVQPQTRTDAAADIAGHIEGAAAEVGWAIRDERAYLDALAEEHAYA